MPGCPIAGEPGQLVRLERYWSRIRDGAFVAQRQGGGDIGKTKSGEARTGRHQSGWNSLRAAAARRHVQRERSARSVDGDRSAKEGQDQGAERAGRQRRPLETPAVRLDSRLRLVRKTALASEGGDRWGC